MTKTFHSPTLPTFPTFLPFLTALTFVMVKGGML